MTAKLRKVSVSVICFPMIKGLNASKLATAASAAWSRAPFALYGHGFGLFGTFSYLFSVNFAAF
ncbi:MAG: hypothetical protein CVU42_13685 [Chloroflexi bacterium HGW-Chloroflexi-4]|nr:MAG: hypothetical protein CVU42_13685 [Chloroflexi bacterium HGW-Chloroflexi-4]